MDFKNECRCCKSENLRKVLDLKDQPLANTYVSSPTKIKTYPLELMLCEDCFHLQLSVVVNPDLLFKNYLYVSGTSKTLEFYFEFLQISQLIDMRKFLDLNHKMF